MQSGGRSRIVGMLSLLLVVFAAAAAWGQQPPLSVQGPPLLPGASSYAPDRLIVKLKPDAATALSQGGPTASALPSSLRATLAAHQVMGAHPLFPHLRPEAGGRGAAGQAAQVRAAFPHRSQRVQSNLPVPDLENIFLLETASGQDPRAAAAALRETRPSSMPSRTASSTPAWSRTIPTTVRPAVGGRATRICGGCTRSMWRRPGISRPAATPSLSR